MAKACILPMILYLLGTTAAAKVPAHLYPLAYTAVVVVVALATWALLRGKGLVAVHGNVGGAVVVGLLGIVLWIALSSLKLEEQIAGYLPAWLRPAPRAAFNPFEQLAHPAAVWGFIAVRILGLALLVPVAEEVFWRGFLARWLVSERWQQVPLGKFTPMSFAVVTLLCTLAHPEWLAAAVYCALLNAWLAWKKNLFDCIVAHAVSNSALGIYVLATGSWWLW